ncbi:MAG: PaaI family thioesterase [Halobacteriales archaeon]
MNDFPDDVAGFVQQRLEDEGSFFAWMGGEVTEVSRDGATIRLPFDDHVTNATEPPTVHGGVTATLVDTVGSLALRPHLENPFEDQVATINLNVNYLRGADDELVARGEVVRAGNSVGVSEIEVTQNAETVAVGQASYRIFGGA